MLATYQPKRRASPASLALTKQIPNMQRPSVRPNVNVALVNSLSPKKRIWPTHTRKGKGSEDSARCVEPSGAVCPTPIFNLAQIYFLLSADLLKHGEMCDGISQQRMCAEGSIVILTWPISWHLCYSCLLVTAVMQSMGIYGRDRAFRALMQTANLFCTCALLLPFLDSELHVG